MRKFLISSAVILLALQTARAQTEKGTQNLGFNVQFSYNKADNLNIDPYNNNAVTTLSTKTTGFSIGPNYSYFIADKIDIGINFAYNTSNTTNVTETYATTNDSDPIKESSNSFSGDIFIRKYYMYKNTIGFRTGAYVGFLNGSSKNTYAGSYTASNNNDITNDYFGGLNLDLVYYPTKKLGVAATIVNLEYQHYKNDFSPLGHDSGEIVNFNFINNGLSLSVFYIIGK